MIKGVSLPRLCSRSGLPQTSAGHRSKVIQAVGLPTFCRRPGLLKAPNTICDTRVWRKLENPQRFGPARTTGAGDETELNGRSRTALFKQETTTNHRCTHEAGRPGSRARCTAGFRVGAQGIQASSLLLWAPKLRPGSSSGYGDVRGRRNACSASFSDKTTRRLRSRSACPYPYVTAPSLSRSVPLFSLRHSAATRLTAAKNPRQARPHLSSLG